MKLISFYLPQFHEIPENNDAWGNGFTEWTNVRKSHSLFIGHNQPRYPLNNNYYNLLDDGVMQWQTDLAKEYGIYGFCMYHYWFNGRLVLEKPAENLLKNSKINFHYCFAWANEPWTKTWHGAGGNKEILIPQTYGGEEDWIKHYEYFRPFFLDERYIKEDNAPMIVIYRLKNIPNFNNMIRVWNELAQRDGFSGVFVITMNTCSEHVLNSRWVNGSVDFEPNMTKSVKLKEKRKFEPKDKHYIWNYFTIKKIQYDKINRLMLRKEHKKNEFRTIFVGYDDSPRRGLQGVVTVGSTPKKFGKYLRKTIDISEEEHNQYIFINAWNEWGEGNYLEPDKKNKYRYLAEIKRNMSKRGR